MEKCHNDLIWNIIILELLNDDRAGQESNLSLSNYFVKTLPIISQQTTHTKQLSDYV